MAEFSLDVDEITNEVQDTLKEEEKKLENSKFRSSFKLTRKEVLYIEEKGIDVIRMHAADFVRNRLAPANPVNDGKQTPMHGHPVFKAMHATACCCRGCMQKWYKVRTDRELTEDEQRIIVNLLIAWIEKNK